MARSISEKEAYDRCVTEGMLVPQSAVEIGKVSSMLRIAEEDQASAEELRPKERWNTIYKIFYDVLHTLTEAYLCFDRVKSQNHQCLFAYLCVRHPELEMDWGFFEKIRTRRNGIHYYGTCVTKEDFKEIELQISLYIRLLKEQIETALRNSK